jgi:hypothetical protein
MAKLQPYEILVLYWVKLPSLGDRDWLLIAMSLRFWLESAPDSFALWRYWMAGKLQGRSIL